MGGEDEHDLERFVAAQDAGGTYERAIGELRAGRKQSHWIWFVFPQLDGLGRSETARRYAISGIEEARAYLADPVLGWRLRNSAAALLEQPERDPQVVLGPVDALKLRSSMTLFARAGDGGVADAVFAQVLEAFFGGEPDDATERLLAPPRRPD